MCHSFSYENEKAGAASKASELLVQLDGQPDLASVYCSQCQLCNKTKVDSETKVNDVLVNGSSTTESNKNVNNNVEHSDKVEDSITNSESRKTTTTSSRVVIDCDAIVSVPHSDDMKMLTSSSNGKNVSGQRSKKKKRGRQLLYSNGASSDVKDSSSQAGDKGSNDDEVNFHAA